jgi:hypothetical protein
MIIKDSIEIKTSPEKVGEWLTNLDKHYKEWHPDHVKWVKITGSVDVGDVIYLEEYIAGRLVKAKSKVTKIEKTDKKFIMELSPLGFLGCITGQKGLFNAKAKGNICIYSSVLSIQRFGCIIPNFFIKAIKKHVKEEGENLKKILEADKNN